MVNHTGMSVLYFSITVQQIGMKIDVDITPKSGCLSLVLCLWSSIVWISFIHSYLIIAFHM